MLYIVYIFNNNVYNFQNTIHNNKNVRFIFTIMKPLFYIIRIQYPIENYTL